MDKNRLTELRNIYRDGLLNDTIPFWQSRFIDQDEGRTVNPGHAIETSWFLLEEMIEKCS